MFANKNNKLLHYKDMKKELIKYSRRFAQSTRELLHKIHDTESITGVAVGIVFLVTLAGDITFLIGSEYFDEVLHYSHGFTALYAIIFILNLVFSRYSDPLSWFDSPGSEEKLREFMISIIGVDYNYVNKITNKEISERIVPLGVDAFGDMYINKNDRKSLFNMWHNANDGVFRLLTEPGNKSVDTGYICVLPLKDEAAAKYLHGRKMSSYGFDANDIFPLDNQTALNIYVGAIYLKPEYQDNQTYIAPLIYGLLCCITEFTKNSNHGMIKILAETVSPDGAKFAKMLGFTKDKKSILGYDIYVLNFAEENPTPKAAFTMELIRNFAKEHNKQQA